MPYVALVPVDPTVSGVEWTRGDGSDVTIVRPTSGAGASTGFIVLDTDAAGWIAEAATHGFALTSVSVAGTSPSPLPVAVLVSGPQTLSTEQKAQALANLGLSGGGSMDAGEVA